MDWKLDHYKDKIDSVKDMRKDWKLVPLYVEKTRPFPLIILTQVSTPEIDIGPHDIVV